jgi:hypothetical protein
MIREVLCFALGAAAGFGAATYFMKTKYEAMVDEEVKSVMEWAKKKEKEPLNNDESVETEELSHSEEVEKFNEIAPNYNKISEKVNKVMDEYKPYRISEGDFVVDDDEYAKVSLEYYSDDDSLFEGSEYISNIEETVGEDNLDFFVSMGDEIMYVRNEKYKTDYEICRIAGRYSEGNNYV